MTLPSLRISTIGLLAAVGAGFAAVLLAMVSRQASYALLMGFVAPLPLMIATIGFGGIAGALAGFIGTLFIGIMEYQLGGHGSGALATAGFDRWTLVGLAMLIFLVYLGVPSFVLGRLAALPIDSMPMRAGQTLRPAERHLALVLSAAAFFAAASIAILIACAGGASAFDARIVKACETFIAMVTENRPLPTGTSAQELASLLAWFVPPEMSMLMVVLFALNLWLAARVSQVSGLLASPWPDIPRHLRMPPMLALLLAVTAGLSFTPGLLGLVSRIVSAALLSAFALQGLAVVHQLTRGAWFRNALLFVVYLTMVLLNGWPLVLWGFVGLLDAAFSFRDRQKPGVNRNVV